MGIRCLVDEGGIQGASWRRSSDPVGIAFVVAESSAGLALEAAAVDDEVFASVSARVGDHEVALSAIHGCGGIGNDVVLKSVFYYQKRPVSFATK